MQTRKETIQYCHSFQDVYEDYPFHDDNWCVMRHKGNKKTFALIYGKDGYVWINVKCDPEWREFWRNAFQERLGVLAARCASCVSMTNF